MKPQIVSYRKYKGLHNETFVHSLRHEFNVQGRFLNEKGLDVFSTISTEIFDKNALKKAIYSYNLTISLSLIRNRFLQNRSEENRKLFCKQRISAFHFWKNLKRIILQT